MLAGWRIVIKACRARRELAQHVRQSAICDAQHYASYVCRTVSCDAPSETGSLSAQQLFQFIQAMPLQVGGLSLSLACLPNRRNPWVCSEALQSLAQAGRITAPERSVYP